MIEDQSTIAFQLPAAKQEEFADLLARVEAGELPGVVPKDIFYACPALREARPPFTGAISGR